MPSTVRTYTRTKMTKRRNESCVIGNKQVAEVPSGSLWDHILLALPQACIAYMATSQGGE
eukprot:1918534-Pyramimonas_sp.AAC.2